MVSAADAAPKTFDDLLAAEDGPLCELVHGRLVDKHRTLYTSVIGTQLSFRIGEFAEAAGNIGWVFNCLPLPCFRWAANHVRRPDVCYFSRERMPDIPTGFSDLPPEFVAEVLTRQDRAVDIDAEVEDYLRAGVQTVWVVNPTTRTVRRQERDGSGRLYHENDSATAPHVIAGLAVPVSGLFPQ